MFARVHQRASSFACLAATGTSQISNRRNGWKQRVGWFYQAVNQTSLAEISKVCSLYCSKILTKIILVRGRCSGNTTLKLDKKIILKKQDVNKISKNVKKSPFPFVFVCLFSFIISPTPIPRHVFLTISHPGMLLHLYAPL